MCYIIINMGSSKIRIVDNHVDKHERTFFNS